MKKYLTIDIGGSAIKYGVIDEELNFITKGSVPTPTDTKENLFRDLKTILVNTDESVEGVAISMPGVIDNESGFAYTGGALEYVMDENLADELEEFLEHDVTICNDAKSAALAEMGYGNLQGIDNAIVVVLGTGIGGAVVINGKLVKGTHFSAGEFSFILGDVHNPVDSSKMFAAHNGIRGLTKEIEIASGLAGIQGIEAFRMIREGSEEVLQGVRNFCTKLAFHLFNMQVILDVERIVIGGGISQEPMMIKLINEAADQQFIPRYRAITKPEITTCKFMNDANLIGALYNFKQVKQK